MKSMMRLNRKFKNLQLSGRQVGSTYLAKYSANEGMIEEQTRGGGREEKSGKDGMGQRGYEG